MKIARVAWWVGLGLVAGPGLMIRGAEPPPLVFSREGSRVKLEFTGILQEAMGVLGPWADAAGAGSPWVVPAEGVGRFYRVRSAQPAGVFEDTSVAEWVIEGPMQRHFEYAFAGMPDGIFPPRREKPWFPGRLRLGGLELEVQCRVRGNSSLQECPFPKMKLKVSRAEREGTPLAAAREIRIGTHCAEGGRGTIGRLREQAATYREALAYEVQSALGFVAPRVRRARIEYVDTSPGGGDETGWRVVREAVVLEDIEVVAERLGGRALSDEETGALANAGFGERILVEMRLLHALLGNWDYLLGEDGRSLWNTEVIEWSDGRRVAVAGDYDLASWVTAEPIRSWPREYHPELGELERETLFVVEQLHGRVGGALFQEASLRFERGRAAVEAAVEAARVDEAGRENARRHVAAFYEALAKFAR